MPLKRMTVIVLLLLLIKKLSCGRMMAIELHFIYCVSLYTYVSECGLHSSMRIKQTQKYCISFASVTNFAVNTIVVLRRWSQMGFGHWRPLTNPIQFGHARPSNLVDPKNGKNLRILMNERRQRMFQFTNSAFIISFSFFFRVCVCCILYLLLQHLKLLIYFLFRGYRSLLHYRWSF